MGRGRTLRRGRLRLLRGGRQREGRLGAVQIVPAAADRPPFPVDAVAAEEDTYLVLSAEPEVRPSREHPIRLMTALYDAVPEDPGSVVVKAGRPLRLLAVVHDLNLEPTWREAWVARALEGILDECARRRFTAVGLPLLGCVHGQLARERFVSLLRRALRKAKPRTLERLWLMVPPGEEERLGDLLR